MALASAMKPLLQSLLQTPESTIVYASTRNQVEDITSFLQQRLEQKGKNVKVEGYHAGLSLNARSDAHTNFLTGRTTIVVATNAFGLGIDKPDTRRVIHFGPPKTVEEYYQQIGKLHETAKFD
jgi:ATP-dependent DNA helicase RecQ/Werner syndrome ATP-dependent helicase